MKPFGSPIVTDRHHAGQDAVAWLQPQTDGSSTMYVIRPGQPTLIVDGLHLRPTAIPPGTPLSRAALEPNRSSAFPGTVGNDSPAENPAP